MKNAKAALVIRCIIFSIFALNGLSFGLSPEAIRQDLPVGVILAFSFIAFLFWWGFTPLILSRAWKSKSRGQHNWVKPNWFTHPFSGVPQFWHLGGFCVVGFGLLALIGRLASGRQIFVEVFFLGGGLGMLVGLNWFYKRISR